MQTTEDNNANTLTKTRAIHPHPIVQHNLDQLLRVARSQFTRSIRTGAREWTDKALRVHVPVVINPCSGEIFFTGEQGDVPPNTPYCLATIHLTGPHQATIAKTLDALWMREIEFHPHTTIRDQYYQPPNIEAIYVVEQTCLEYNIWAPNDKH